MTWVRLDDQFSIHRKNTRLSDAAFRLQVSALCWSARNLADGYIQAGDLADIARIRTPARYAAELVNREVWHLGMSRCDSPKCPDANAAYSWRIHDYFVYQYSKDQIVAQRDADAARQRKSRLSRRDSQESHTMSHTYPGPSRPVSGSVVTGLNAVGQLASQRSSSNGVNGAATRQPPPFAQAVAAALNPPTTWDAFTRPEPP